MSVSRFKNINKKYVLPPIGMRIMKSAAGVFLCYILDMFRNGQGIVFYSQLAVLWCMQDYTKETLRQARQRTLGTVIGAIYGLVVLLVARLVPQDDSILRELVWGLIISGFIILILYTTVVIKKRQASYFSCVVFLSIVVNHLSDANPYIFVWNRFLDTMIGILLGVIVNCFSLPREHRNNILFVSGLDDTLLSEDDNLSGYSRVELNRMIDSGAKFTVSTMRTPASLMEPLREINLKLPVIVMDGAALYDIKQNRYLNEYVISYDCSKRLISFFEEKGINYFSNVIVDDLLIIYYQETESEMYNELIKQLRVSPYRNYVKRPLPEDEPVVYFMVLEKKERLEAVYSELQKQEYADSLKMLFYDSKDYPGYAYLKVYNHNATRENMLYYLRRYMEEEGAGANVTGESTGNVKTGRKIEKVVTFGTIEGKYTYTINPGDSNRVVKLMKKEYEPIKGRWFK